MQKFPLNFSLIKVQIIYPVCIDLRGSNSYFHKDFDHFTVELYMLSLPSFWKINMLIQTTAMIDSFNYDSYMS